MFEKLKEDCLPLLKKIEESKKDDELISYKVSPILKELIALLEQEKSEDEETLDFLFECYVYVATVYATIGRFSLSAKYNQISIQIARKLNGAHAKLKDILYRTLRDRNYYIDDDCEDIQELVKGLLPDSIIDKYFEERLRSRRSLKHDPIEMSEEYLAVIDEVEEKVDKSRTIFGLGACHEIWHLKFQYLLEKGITWHSPAMLNPHVMFD